MSDTLTTAQLAKRWGYRPQTLREWRRSGHGPDWFRPSGSDRGKVLYRISDIEAWEKSESSRLS